MEILDVHQHMGLIADFVHGSVEDESEDPEVREFRTRTATMDRSGIHRAIIGPGYQYLMPNGVADTAKVNDRLAAFRDEHPERFPFAVGAIEARQGEAALDEVRRIRRDLGMVGVLWHNRLQGCRGMVWRNYKPSSLNSCLPVDSVSDPRGRWQRMVRAIRPRPPTRRRSPAPAVRVRRCASVPSSPPGFPLCGAAPGQRG